VGVVGGQRARIDIELLLLKFARAAEVAQHEERGSQVSPRQCQVGMVGGQRARQDLECLLLQHTRAGKVPQLVERGSQVPAGEC